MTKTRDLANLGGGFIQVGATVDMQRTVESKLQDVVSVLDFIPESEHADIKAGTSTYDAGPDIQKAVDTGKAIEIPNGTYLVETAITVPQNNLVVVGVGWPVLVAGTNNIGIFQHNQTVYHVRISGIRAKAATGVTGAKFYYGTNPNYYTAYAELKDLILELSFEVSIKTNLILSTLKNIQDGYYGTSPGAQTHIAVSSGEGATTATNLVEVKDSAFFRSSSATQGSIHLELASVWHITNCDFEIGARAITAKGVAGLAISSCWFEDNDGPDIIKLENHPVNSSYQTDNIVIRDCKIDFKLPNTGVNYFANISSNPNTRVSIENFYAATIPTGTVLCNITTAPRLALKSLLRASGDQSLAGFLNGAVDEVDRFDSSGNFLLGGTLPSAPNLALKPTGDIDAVGRLLSAPVIGHSHGQGAPSSADITNRIASMWLSASAQGSWARSSASGGVQHTSFRTGSDNSYLVWDLLLHNCTEVVCSFLYVNAADATSRTLTSEYSVDGGSNWVSLGSVTAGPSGGSEFGGTISFGSGTAGIIRYLKVRVFYASGATSSDVIGIRTATFKPTCTSAQFTNSLNTL